MNQQTDTLDLIGINVKNKATQTIGGDNLFISELRDEQLKEERKKMYCMKMHVLRNREKLSPKFKGHSLGSSTKFNVLKMLLSAQNNKNQKEGDCDKLRIPGRFIYKQFVDFRKMVLSFPLGLLKVLDEFMAKEQILKALIFP